MEVNTMGYKKLSDEQEKSVRQGMSKSRGDKIIEVRKYLPTQEYFVDFIRRTKIKDLISFADGKIKKTTIEHWYRRDVKGFSYPTVADWNIVSDLKDSDKMKNPLDKYEQLCYNAEKKGGISRGTEEYPH